MSEGHVILPKKIYFAIFFALMICTYLTWWVAGKDFGELNIVIALSIAFFKATLVVLFFMHVRYSEKLTWVVIITGVLWLGILFVLTMSDYYSRIWLITYQ
jgi:cytochrome c oxidase subunit IV